MIVRVVLANTVCLAANSFAQSNSFTDLFEHMASFLCAWSYFNVLNLSVRDVHCGSL